MLMFKARTDGSRFHHQYNNIVSIKVNEPDTEFLEPKTLNAIASALMPEAIKYIESHEKYAETMTELIQEFLKKNLGEIKGELPFILMDKMYLNKAKE